MKKMTKKLNSFLFVVALIPALFFTSNIFANDATPHLKIVPGKIMRSHLSRIMLKTPI